MKMVLKDSRAKLRRAQEHLDAIKGQIQTFLDDKPYRVVVDPPVHHRFIVRLDNAPEIPAEDWAFIVDDCIHNLRVALDYIAWRLAGSDPRDTHTQFPIFTTEQSWNTNSCNMIRRMRPKAQAILKKLQPFNGSDPAHAALSGIRALDNADKHKLLTVVVATPLDFSVEWVKAGTPDILSPQIALATSTPELSGNTVLASIVDPHASNDVEMQATLTPDIAFGEGLFPGPPRTLVIPSLNADVAEVREGIKIFEGRPELFSS